MTDNRPWVEKYRPTRFEDIVLDPLNRKLLKNIVTQNKFPNLLFTDHLELVKLRQLSI